MAAMQQAFGDPEVLLGAVRSAEQVALEPELDAAVAVTIGVIDWVVDAVAVRIIGGNSLQIAEAVRRRRAEASPDDIFVERLLGIRLGAEQTARGKAFVQGVVDRAGENGLAPLFSDPSAVPTPNEIEAPGLWLARVAATDPTSFRCRRAPTEQVDAGPGETAADDQEADRPGHLDRHGDEGADRPRELEARLEHGERTSPVRTRGVTLHDALEAQPPERGHEVQHRGQHHRTDRVRRGPTPSPAPRTPAARWSASSLRGPARAGRCDRVADHRAQGRHARPRRRTRACPDPASAARTPGGRT
jgi:hypothetical protein